MRGDIIFRVYGRHTGRESDTYFRAFRTKAEAEAQIDRLNARAGWAAEYHNLGFVIRPTTVETDFEIPPLPKPRDKYAVKLSDPNGPGTRTAVRVEVFRRGISTARPQRICEYGRNYEMLQTFEPFRKRNREFALISRFYDRTAVLDLNSGDVIAEEEELAGGFCPVGFFVPDWWDVHNRSELPGCEYWTADDEWPTGDFGFVWGCHWGDESSWKVQYLDLSQVEDGVIRSDERFGYVELATRGYTSPCLAFDSPPVGPSAHPPFIRMYRRDGIANVTFAVDMAFDLQTGNPEEWKRLRIAEFE